MYERMLESIISLFIPFYDEFKSLALLFLILTRARVSRIFFYEVYCTRIMKMNREQNLFIYTLYDLSSNLIPGRLMPH